MSFDIFRPTQPFAGPPAYDAVGGKAVVTFPQVPRCNGAIGRPLAGVSVHGGHGGHFLVAVDALNRLADAQVTHRKHVKAAQEKDEKHFRRPHANASDLRQLPRHFASFNVESTASCRFPSAVLLAKSLSDACF